MGNKRLTILHNNDIHNQLYFRIDKNFVMNGGVSLLSSYIKSVRNTEKNTLFTISGDVLQEDISESDYKGSNTVKVINQLKPDAISLGNHELDYGLDHLLIFKECIEAPILNANIRVELLEKDLFYPSKILKAGDVRMLAIGVIPEAFYKRIMSDVFCQGVLSYEDSYAAIRREIAKYDENDYDLTVLLSHYGYEGDITLAENMPDDINVNIILGGHSHIDMDEALYINGILLAQSGYGTKDIGRFDLELSGKKIVSWKWERVKIDSNMTSFDEELDTLADNTMLKKKKKSRSRKICSFAEEYENRSRVLETQVGDIIADAFSELYDVDFVILQSGSIRRKSVPLEMQEKDMRELYPFDDAFCSVELTGKTLLEMFGYLFSLKPDGSVMNGTFQYSKGLNIIADGLDYQKYGVRLESITFNGRELENDRKYRVGVTQNCLNNFEKYFNKTVSPDDSSLKIHSYSTYHDLQYRFMSYSEPITAPETGNRFVLKNFEG